MYRAIIFIVTACLFLQVSWADSLTTLELQFFDRNGKSLSYAEFRNLSNNGETGYDNDVLINPTTYEVLEVNPIYTKNKKCLVNLGKDPAAIALNWPTIPQGYTLLVLDNLGKGFKSGGIVNVPYAAALDTMNDLNQALENRPDYIKSNTFSKHYNLAQSYIEKAKKSLTPSLKGKYGQLALDQLAVAYDALLYEYGAFHAQKNKSRVVPWIGFTIDTLENAESNCNLVASISQPYGWIRIVFDRDTPIEDYAELVKYAHLRGLKILGKPIDSFYDSSYDTEAYLQRFKDLIALYPEIEAWEIGNEVNGSWLSKSISEKIKVTADYVHNKAKKTTVLTFFWQLNTDSKENAMFNWMKTNVPTDVRNNIDVAFVSQYQEQAPMGLFFDQMMMCMLKEFPNALIGLGELGYWEPGQQYWWAYDEKEPNTTARHAVCKQYYNAALGYPRSVGGSFWWDYCRQFPDDEAMKNIVIQLRYQIKGVEE